MTTRGTSPAPGVFGVTFTISPALPWMITSALALAACVGLLIVRRRLVEVHRN